MDPEPWSDGGLGNITLSAIDARTGRANANIMIDLFNDGMVVDYNNE